MFSLLWGAGILLLWLLVIPMLVGMPFAEALTEPVDGKRQKAAGLALLCGTIELWALFQVIAVSFILTTGKFHHVVSVFMITVLAGAIGVILWKLWCAKKQGFLRTKKQRRIPFWEISDKEERTAKCIELVVWLLFLLLAAFQIIQSSQMAFADGDDAFYIPISAFTKASDTMYQTIPYTGESTQLDLRHGLAPFPVWIAFLSSVSGIPATILAQSVLGGVFLIFGYVLYYQIAKVLFARQSEGIPYFMLFVSLLQLLGNYSFYTAETFLLTRTSQGKAVLSGLILPFLFLCLLLLGKEYQKEENTHKGVLCVLIVLTTIASWLCSSLGTFLCAALLGVSSLVMAVAGRSCKPLLQGLACALPSVLFAIFYFCLQ